jgi:hypothetical protein
MSASILIPRQAPMWPGFLVLCLAVGVAWLVLDPASGVEGPKLIDSFNWSWFGPYSVVTVGVLSLMLAAVWDFFRIRRWASGSWPDGWTEHAYDWSKERVPAMCLPSHVREEVTKVRIEICNAISVRWGRYFAIGFALLPMAFLVGWWQLRVPLRGSDQSGTFLIQAFGPLAAATAGIGLVLLVVIASARTAQLIAENWGRQADARVITESNEEVTSRPIDDEIVEIPPVQLGFDGPSQRGDGGRGPSVPAAAGTDYLPDFN